MLRMSGSQSFQACQRELSVLGPLLFILYTSKMFELVENKLIAYADGSTLLAVVRKPVNRLTVDASLNRDLARI